MRPKCIRAHTLTVAFSNTEARRNALANTVSRNAQLLGVTYDVRTEYRQSERGTGYTYHLATIISERVVFRRSDTTYDESLHLVRYGESDPEPGGFYAIVSVHPVKPPLRTPRFKAYHQAGVDLAAPLMANRLRVLGATETDILAAVARLKDPTRFSISHPI